MIILKSELKSSLQERSFKVFLYTAILCASTEHSITGYEINRFFLKKHRVFIVPAQLTPVDYHGKKRLDRIHQEQRRESLCTNGKRRKDSSQDGGDNQRNSRRHKNYS